MQSILAALSRWHPPDGTVRSVTVEVDRETSAHSAMVTIERSRDAIVSFVLTLGYSDALNLPLSTIVHRLTALALDACAAPSVAPSHADVARVRSERPPKPQGRPAA
jgi:hypothetical protein